MKAYGVLSSAAALLNLTVVRGEDLVCNGSCVSTWGKCSGEGIASGTIRPCCNPDDHCVQKDAAFGQCRPKSRDVPASWPSGAILTCTDPEECDPSAIGAHLLGLSANWFTFPGNDDIELDYIFTDYLDPHDGCLNECQANPDCFAYDLTVDGDCTLFGKNLFTQGSLQPFFDAEIILTKCFLPEPLCDPATREVRRIHPVTAPGGGFHQMDVDSDARDFLVSPPDYALTAAINACRLQRERNGGCVGFALEPYHSAFSGDMTLVTLLFGPNQGVDYRGDLADNPQVYSIAECL